MVALMDTPGKSCTFPVMETIELTQSWQSLHKQWILMAFHPEYEKTMVLRMLGSHSTCLITLTEDLIEVRSHGRKVWSSGMKVQSNGMEVRSNGRKVRSNGTRIRSNGMQVAIRLHFCPECPSIRIFVYRFPISFDYSIGTDFNRMTINFIDIIPRLQLWWRIL